eukprot:scaffold22599_cov139-Cylindrotheca_fusiformis.AAC.23
MRIDEASSQISSRDVLNHLLSTNSLSEDAVRSAVKTISEQKDALRQQQEEEVEAEEPAGGGLMETLQLGGYFAEWYFFNIAYNIYNKQALNVLDYPWTVATLQMATGIAYFVPLWLLGIRKAPKLNASELKTLLPIAFCHTGVHVGAVIALGAGAVSFARIVKASEPVVTCALNAVLLGHFYRFLST